MQNRPPHIFSKKPKETSQVILEQFSHLQLSSPSPHVPPAYEPIMGMPVCDDLTQFKERRKIYLGMLRNRSLSDGRAAAGKRKRVFTRCRSDSGIVVGHAGSSSLAKSPSLFHRTKPSFNKSILIAGRFGDLSPGRKSLVPRWHYPRIEKKSKKPGSNGPEVEDLIGRLGKMVVQHEKDLSQ
ncbi:hypothetical protein HDV03_004008 [Kappamyces sp. JEL0829]|nr:hypothetical protein HDV03_004008 [Kappamyces sp. JEL0829]